MQLAAPPTFYTNDLILAQLVRALAPEPGDLSLVPGIHTVEGKN